METIEVHETLTPDSIPTDNNKPAVSPRAKTLVATDSNAEVESPFSVGDFVWAKAKDHPWWPAVVSAPTEFKRRAQKSQKKRHSVLVAYFGDDDTLAWCEPKQLKPFFPLLDEMARRSSSESFLGALGNCMEEVLRCLELEITCHCVPVETRPKQLQRNACTNLPVGNYSPQEFLDCILDVARDVRAVNMLKAVRLRSWVVAFGKDSLQGESWVFHRHCGMEELLDKMDLDTLQEELVNGKEEDEVLVTGSGTVKGPGASTGKPQHGRRKSMAKLIAEMDLDAVEVDNDDKEQCMGSKKRKKGEAAVFKVEEEAGSCSGRRERKKSKYLSPPYANLVEGKFLDLLPKSCEKTPRKAAGFSDLQAAGSSAIIKCKSEQDEDKNLLLKIEKTTAYEIFSEFVAIAANPLHLHLKWSITAKVVKCFFAMYRGSMYSGKAQLDVHKKLVHESVHEIEVAVDKVRKLKHNEKKKYHQHGAFQETDFDLKQHKSISKYAADCKIKLDLKKSKKKFGADQENDEDSKQQGNDLSEKQKPGRRKKVSKDGRNPGVPDDSEFCMAHVSKEGKQKQKTGRYVLKDGTCLGALVHSSAFYVADASDQRRGKQKAGLNEKISKEGTSQGALVGSDLDMADASDEGKGKQKPRKKMSNNGTSQGALLDFESHLAYTSDEAKEKMKPGRKKSNDGTSKEALVDLDLHIADASDEGKLGQGFKRSKNDDNGEATVNVAVQMVSSFHEGSSRKKERVSKDANNVEDGVGLDVEPINCQKPVLLVGKKLESKEDAFGKSLQNLDRNARVSWGDKSGCKKKNGNGPPRVKSGRRKGKMIDSIYGSQAALQLTFHSGIALPSVEDLVTTYSKYGALINTRIELLKDSHSARVVFASSSDAENAFKDKAGPYGSVATYALHYLPKNLITLSQTIPVVVSPSMQLPDLKSAFRKPPLPYIRKSLETMISTLGWSSSLVNYAGSSSDGLKPEVRNNLVGEMQGLLQKVDKILNGADSSSSA